MLLSIIFSLLFLQIGISCSNTNVKTSDKFSLSTMENLKSKTNDGIIKFSSDLLKKFSLLDHPKRDFNLFILFNALDKETNCQVCGIAAESFAKYSGIFNKKAKMGHLPTYFATIELRENIEAFQIMGLDHVPVIMHFGPESRAPKKYENNDPNDPTKLLQFFATQSHSEINIEDIMKPETNHNLKIVLASAVVILSGLVLSGKLPASVIFKNTYFWSVSIMTFIMLMLSGYMWTRIRNPPFVGNQMGEIMYFSNSPQAQLGVESRIITGINAAIVIIFLLSTQIIYKLEDHNKRRVAAMVLSLLYMAGHAGLLKIFIKKFPGYPLSYIF